MKILLTLAALTTVCASPVLAQDAVVRDNPPELLTSPRFTNVVEVPASARLILVSGLTAQGSDGVAPKGAVEQAQAVFRNLRIALTARGLTPADVIQIRGFLVDIQTTLPAYRQAAGEFFGKAPPPASTVVGVAGLVRPDLLLEVELIAAKPANAK